MLSIDNFDATDLNKNTDENFIFESKSKEVKSILKKSIAQMLTKLYNNVLTLLSDRSFVESKRLCVIFLHHFSHFIVICFRNIIRHINCDSFRQRIVYTTEVLRTFTEFTNNFILINLMKLYVTFTFVINLCKNFKLFQQNHD